MLVTIQCLEGGIWSCLPSPPFSKVCYALRDKDKPSLIFVQCFPFYNLVIISLLLFSLTRNKSLLKSNEFTIWKNYMLNVVSTFAPRAGELPNVSPAMSLSLLGTTWLLACFSLQGHCSPFCGPTSLFTHLLVPIIATPKYSLGPQASISVQLGSPGLNDSVSQISNFCKGVSDWSSLAQPPPGV